MGKLIFEIPDNIEYDFRKDAYQTFGMKQGSLKKALIEAVKMWMDAKSTSVRRKI